MPSGASWPCMPLLVPSVFGRILTRTLPTTKASRGGSGSCLDRGERDPGLTFQISATTDVPKPHGRRHRCSLLSDSPNTRPQNRHLSSTSFVCRTFQLSSTSNSKSNNNNKYNNIMTTITYELLTKQNAETSNALIDHWKDNEDFLKLASYEGDLTVKRDQEDGDKLQKGIDFAKSKGVIDPDFIPEPYRELDVMGKSPEQVAGEILATVRENSGGDGDGGTASVIILCGLSGTGKGTTVSKLRQLLESEDPPKDVVTWSNGNIFRSVTYLAATWCEQNGCDSGFDPEKALTKENIASFMDMLEFGKFHDGTKYDTRIKGLGVDMFVSEVQNTELKSPKVSKNIPTVAESTQGEVILFASKAVDILGKAGIVVLLEGREQTVNYVRTPHRFTLVLSDDTLIGKRRAAQRLMAATLKAITVADGEAAYQQQLEEALESALAAMVKEIE